MSEENDDDPEYMRQATSPEYRMEKLIEKLSERVEAQTEESRQRTEETQRNIEFILQQQAQFVTDIQKLREAQAATDNIVERLATVTLNRFEVVEREASNLESKMAALVDSHIKLADAQTNTDERLSAFIVTVERLLNEGRNGK
jgi:predicted  nucleic acid-binding Zn-ribbon protein